MNQLQLFEIEDNMFLTIKDASLWASQYLSRNITVSNISYLIQYGRIKNYGSNGNPLIKKEELMNYYEYFNNKENQWKTILGNDVNWHLSFVEYKEAERTKHVHRLHPYKGKFIPQLVEYFLDSHTDEIKSKILFHISDNVLDPFCGSGTTLVQANELGMHAIGIDISAFNALISNVKIQKHNILELNKVINNLTDKFIALKKSRSNILFEDELLAELNKFNYKYFPSPEYKRKLINNEINEKEYAKDKEIIFLNIYNELVKKYKINIMQDSNNTFLEKWFMLPVREEIEFLFKELKKIEDHDLKKVMATILSRTVRSCRATTHADLGTLKDPIIAAYYCRKHGKICKPIFSIKGWWEIYTKDAIKRLTEFNKLRTDTFQICLVGDSRSINIMEEIKKRDQAFADILLKKKIKGIFSSPPYVGLIDYHEQHAYAYEIFGFERKDELEIGPLYKGSGKEAKDSYVKAISEVLINCRNWLSDDFEIFLVANDKYDLYPKIADLSNMKIINQFKRPVLNRVEKDRESAYAESIFYLKSK